MTANVLDISHLTLSIERKTILQDIDLTIGAGETAALIGESGSGKSTLAQCILGLQPQRSRLTPESRIDFLGEPLPIENDARMRRWRGCSISMIFQDPMSCLNPYLRVGTQILEALKRGSASNEDPHARVLELLEMVDLPQPKQTAGKYPYELSGGQQQRIMVAMALANRPQLLIADEPTSSLDACVQAEILKLLERLQKAFALSMLFITHNMAAARFLAHRVYVLQHGRMAESGDTAAVFAHPRETYTAELIRAKENLAALQPVACEAQNNASPPPGSSQTSPMPIPPPDSAAALSRRLRTSLCASIRGKRSAFWESPGAENPPLPSCLPGWFSRVKARYRFLRKISAVPAKWRLR